MLRSALYEEDLENSGLAWIWKLNGELFLEPYPISHF